MSLTSATLTYDLTHHRSSPGGWRGRRERRRHTSTGTAAVSSCSCLDFTTNNKKLQSRSISWPMNRACVAPSCRLRSGGQIKIKRLHIDMTTTQHQEQIWVFNYFKMHLLHNNTWIEFESGTGRYKRHQVVIRRKHVVSLRFQLHHKSPTSVLPSSYCVCGVKGHTQKLHAACCGRKILFDLRRSNISPRFTVISSKL